MLLYIALFPDILALLNWILALNERMEVVSAVRLQEELKAFLSCGAHKADVGKNIQTVNIHTEEEMNTFLTLQQELCYRRRVKGQV